MTSTTLHPTTSSTGIDPKDPLSDFRNFLYLTWKHLNLPDPTPVQYDIAWYLQHGPRRKIIEAFRGVGKSWITSAYVCWRLLRNPQVEILVVSASKVRADDFTTFTLRLIREMPVLQHLMPREGQRQSRISFDVGPKKASHSPSVKSVGITGQLSGSRADEIIADDVEVPNNSATQMMRDKLSEAVKEFDAILKPGGVVTYLGTPQTEQSLYNELPNRGYEVRIWPARVPSEKVLPNYGERLAPMIQDMVERGVPEGESTDPKRFNHHDLLEREVSYGKAGFALQFMLDTRLADADRYPLKLRDLVVMSCDPEVAPGKIVWASSPELSLTELPTMGFSGDRFYRPMWIETDSMIPYQGTVMSIDPAGRGKDQTGYAVVKQLHGYLFLVAAGGLSGGYDEETLETLAQTAKRHKVNHIVIEANFGDGMFSQLLKPVLQRVHPCQIEEVKHSIQKEKRIIDTLEPVMMAHKLIVDPKVIEDDFRDVQALEGERAHYYSLFYQMTRITHERGALIHDDRLDALSIAVNYWTEAMARDADKALQRHREKLLDEELRKFMRAAGGTVDSEDLWIRV